MRNMADSPLASMLRHVQALVGRPLHADHPDACLLQEFLDHKSPAAFATIVQRHGPLVWRVCRRVLGSDDKAEDAFQATFLVLARKATTIRKTRSLASWLHGVAFRVSCQVRSQSVRKAPRANRSHVIADPAQQATLNEIGRIIEEEIHALPEKLRLPILLCYWEDKTNEEAARILGWACGTVKTRVARARPSCISVLSAVA